jgi:hypothetical protein
MGCNCGKKKVVVKPIIVEEYIPLTPEDFFENSEYNGEEIDWFNNIDIIESINEEENTGTNNNK